MVFVVLNAKAFCLQVWDRPWWARPVHRSQRFNSSLATVLAVRVLQSHTFLLLVG
jgi:hypothetical protein